MSQPLLRQHISARREDLVHRGLRAVAMRKGWTAAVMASIGYGGPDVVRVFGPGSCWRHRRSTTAHRSGRSATP